MIDFNKSCGCGINQILNINEFTFNDISVLKILGDCNSEYNLNDLQFSYSLDNVCWSCYVSYNEFLEITADIEQDYYLKVKVPGVITNVLINDESYLNISTQIDSSFKFGDTLTTQSLYNPYINMECAISLYQTMTEMISNVIGIACYYFKLSPNQNSRDLTFKEYALMNVETVKQVKLIIQDNQMPSSKPEFNDFGLDWQTDWEVEVSKQSFATAFGIKAKPMEGDFIYIPMMKRMWMVNGAWEEKKDAFMWNASTFKLTLVKYQEKDSVDLGDTESLVNSFVKTKYEDLFGDEENVGSGYDTINNEAPYQGKLYNVYESDAIRKSVDTDNVEISEKSLYYKGNLIADMNYVLKGNVKSNQLEYQTKFCGENGTLSFIISSLRNRIDYDLIQINNLRIQISQSGMGTTLTCLNSNQSIKLNNGDTYFVYLRWSKQLNLVEFSAAKYVYNQDVPLYKLQPAHYWFDIDNRIKKISKYSIEMNVIDKAAVKINNFKGTLTNFKLFDEYVSDEKEILQMYPNHNHLLINDTARKLITINGSNIG